MTRVALACGEPLRKRMAGIGIRYLEMARRLPGHGIDVVLLTRSDPADVPELPSGARTRRVAAGNIAEAVADCDGIVAQGSFADTIVAAAPDLPLAIDLYDPWLVENLHYWNALGEAAYRRDLRSWLEQMSRGDFFLVSSREQRLYYLGFLTALGRVAPELAASDPELRRLVAVAPFGVPSSLPAHRPVLPKPATRHRVLFGCPYDWLDPWPVLEALERLADLDCSIVFVATPNPDTTPQARMREIREWHARSGAPRSGVEIVDWIAVDRRFDLYRDVDAVVVAHRPGLETDLSFRTRVLDALAAGCPVVATEGGPTSELLARHGAGRTVPPGDPAAMAAALRATLTGAQADVRREAAASLSRRYGWDRVLDPIVEFCSDPAAYRKQAGPGVSADTWRGQLRRLASRLPGRPGA